MEIQSPLNDNKVQYLFFRKTIAILFGICLFFVAVGILLQIVPDPQNPLCTLGKHFMFFTIPALVLPVIIGFHQFTHRPFLRSAYHAYAFTVILIIIASIVTFFIFDYDVTVYFVVPLGVFSLPIYFLDINDSWALVMLIPMLLLFVLLMGSFLSYFRKRKNKTIRYGGQATTFLLFGILYGVGYFLLVQAIAAVIALPSVIGILSAQ